MSAEIYVYILTCDGRPYSVFLDRNQAVEEQRRFNPNGKRKYKIEEWKAIKP